MIRAIISASILFLPLLTGAEKKPNIIIIIADDLGYGDVGCNGSATIKTPHIDALAAQGIRFTNGHCSASTCTPTRYSLLTGTHAFRTKGTGIAAPNGPAIIKAGTVTLPSLLQSVGYKTAVIGKWHLGLGTDKPDWNGELKPGPLEIGFNHCLLLPTTNDRVPQVYVENHRVRNLDPADPLWVGDTAPAGYHPTGITHRTTLKMDWSHGHNGTIHNGISRIGFYTGGMKARFRDEDLADEWMRESKKWITTNRANPFFLYFAAHDIHVPRAPHERFHGKSGQGMRGDSILEFDWCVGEIMKILEENNLTENTLVILCSDNGPVLDDGYKDDAVEKIGAHKPSGIYRGGKYSNFEGGTRTPFITHWKGRITPAVSDALVSTIDFPASLAALANAKIPETACEDSVNVLPAFLGEKDSKGRPHLLTQDNNGLALSLRQGEWKIIRQTNKKSNKKTHQLYHLAEDPSEANNLATKNPEKLTSMISLMDKIIAQ